MQNLQESFNMACCNILLPSKNTAYVNQQYVKIILHSWQNISAANSSHHQAKIEQSVGTLKVCNQWDPISIRNPMECILSIYLHFVLFWPVDDCLEPKHVAKNVK
jgi:hypothetical protein